MLSRWELHLFKPKPKSMRTHLILLALIVVSFCKCKKERRCSERDAASDVAGPSIKIESQAIQGPFQWGSKYYDDYVNEPTINYLKSTELLKAEPLKLKEVKTFFGVHY